MFQTVRCNKKMYFIVRMKIYHPDLYIHSVIDQLPVPAVIRTQGPKS